MWILLFCPGRCRFQPSVALLRIQCVQSKAFIFQNIFQNLYRFKKKLLRTNDIQFSCNVKNFSETVLASKNLFFIEILVFQRFLVHLAGTEKFFLDQLVFFFYKLDIFLILHTDITADCSYSKVKNKRDPV